MYTIQPKIMHGMLLQNNWKEWSKLPRGVMKDNLFWSWPGFSVYIDVMLPDDRPADDSILCYRFRIFNHFQPTVTEILENSVAANAGLKVGDILWSYDGHDLTDKDIQRHSINEIINKTTKSDTVTLVIVRDNIKKPLVIPAGKLLGVTVTPAWSPDAVKQVVPEGGQ